MILTRTPKSLVEWFLNTGCIHFEINEIFKYKRADYAYNNNAILNIVGL